VSCSYSFHDIAINPVSETKRKIEIMNLYLSLLARPRRFELLTLGLEMRGIGYTNDIVLHRFVILQYLFYYVSMKMA